MKKKSVSKDESDRSRTRKRILDMNLSKRDTNGQMYRMMNGQTEVHNQYLSCLITSLHLE